MYQKFKLYLPLIFTFLSAITGSLLIPQSTGPQPFYANDFCVITPVRTCVFITSTSTPSPTSTPVPASTPLPTPTSIPRPAITPTLPFSKGVAYPLHCEDMTLVGADWTYNATLNPKVCPDVTGSSNMRDQSTWVAVTVGTTTMPSDVQVISGCNEPDLCPDQGCSTPLEWVVIQHWIDEYYPDVTQLSPVPSPNDYYHTWLPAHRTIYFNTYSAYPNWDYLNAHTYLYVMTGSAGITHNLTQMVRHMEWHFDTAEEWQLKGTVISEFGVIVFKDNYGNFLYDEGVSLLDRFWSYPEQESFTEQSRWYTKYGNRTLGEMISAVAWYTAHDDPYWGFGPNATTELYDEDHNLTPLGVWFFELDIN